MAGISFDIGLIPRGPAAEEVELAAAAEERGFSGVWVADSQCVFRDAFAILALCAARTRRIRLATGVTNPVTRHPAVLASSLATLNELSEGRAVLGIGVGESAVRTLGLRPARLDELEEVVGVLRSLWERKPVKHRGTEIRMSWPEGGVPIYVAASGPRALELAGRVADGVLFQAGSHPQLVDFALRHIRKGMEQAGRKPGAVKILARLACLVSSDAQWAKEEIRSYAAAAARTVFGAVPEPDIPVALRTDLARLKERYDYSEHVSREALHRELVTERILEGIAVVGTPAEVVPRLKEIAAKGIDGFVIPVATSRPREVLQTLSEDVLPRFQ